MCSVRCLKVPYQHRKHGADRADSRVLLGEVAGFFQVVEQVIALLVEIGRDAVRALDGRCAEFDFFVVRGEPILIGEAGRPLRAPELARRFDAVEPRHGDVEHDDIRMEPFRLSEEFVSIARSTDHQTFAGQRVDRQREHRRMIISQ